MVSDSNPPKRVLRVVCGPGTGDRVYVVEGPFGEVRIPEPMGTHRVEVLEADKLGARLVRVLR